MSVDLRKIDQLAPDRIESLNRLPIVGVFYTEFLLNIWKRLYQWEDVVLTAGDTCLIGFIKKTSLGNIFYSLPFGWYGGVVCSADNAPKGDQIFAWLEQRSFLQENIVQLVPEGGYGPRYPDRYTQKALSTHILDLQASPDLNDNTRRNIRAANDAGFKIARCHERDLPQFLSLLRQQVSRTQERRRLPEDFYSELFLHGCKAPGDVIALGAALQEELCAVHLYFRNAEDIFYFDGVASNKGKELGANFAIFDHVIMRNREEGQLRLNFGATPVGDAGLDRFKSGWGATKHTYHEFSRRSLLKQGIDFMVRR